MSANHSDVAGELPTFFHDVNERRAAEARKGRALHRSETCLAAQKEAFQLAMSGQPLAASLFPLTRVAVELCEGSPRAAFFKVKSDGKTLAHIVGMSDAYAKDVDGFAVGPDSFACGLAMYSGKPFIRRDVAEEPLWKNWLWMAQRHGFRGCSSFPVRTEGSPIVGTFALYFAEAREPSDEDIELVGVLAHAASIIISRHLEYQERIQAAEALREADRRKDEFVATLAHELRNPLAPIRYAARIARRQESTATQRQNAIDVIERQAGHMARLLDDLLDVSRITRGSLVLRKDRVELSSVVSAAIEAARPMIDGKGHSLLTDLPKHSVHLDADAVRLTQIFSNLLTNAAKYTDADGGRIELRARVVANEAVVTVRDNGIGIGPEMLPTLFTIFSQAQSALERADGGLGIGLALVRGLVQLHDGTVTARSDGIGRGSEFEVRLPLGMPESIEIGDSQTIKVNGAAKPRRVLVADDNLDGAEACAILLRIQGHDVHTAHTGRKALQLAEILRPDIALLDIGMPELNGYEVAERIRATQWGQRMTLIAITGWGQHSDKERASAAGFDAHVTKPVDPQHLEALLLDASLK